MIFEVLGDLGGDFLGSCEDFEDKNNPKGTKMEGKRHKIRQKVPRTCPRAAKERGEYEKFELKRATSSRE